MEITDVRIRKFEGETKMKAVASVTFDNELCVHDIKVVQFDDRTIIAMPNRRSADGTFSDVVHPISKDAREKIEIAVLQKYDSLC